LVLTGRRSMSASRFGADVRLISDVRLIRMRASRRGSALACGQAWILRPGERPSRYLAERSRSKGKDMATEEADELAYRPKYVAFVDVLGFSTLVRAGDTDPAIRQLILGVVAIL